MKSGIGCTHVMRRFLVTCPSREIHDTENLELVDLDALQAATGKVRRIGWKRRPVPSEHRQIGGEHAHPRLRAVRGAPLVIEQASIDINMAPHSAYDKVRHLEAGVPAHRKTRTRANAAGAY
jgi:hypothetical protein